MGGVLDVRNREALSVPPCPPLPFWLRRRGGCTWGRGRGRVRRETQGESENEGNNWVGVKISWGGERGDSGVRLANHLFSPSLRDCETRGNVTVIIMAG